MGGMAWRREAGGSGTRTTTVSLCRFGQESVKARGENVGSWVGVQSKVRVQHLRGS